MKSFWRTIVKKRVKKSATILNSYKAKAMVLSSFIMYFYYTQYTMFLLTYCLVSTICQYVPIKHLHKNIYVFYYKKGRYCLVHKSIRDKHDLYTYSQ